MSEHIAAATAQSFADEVLEPSRTMPVLVDFRADWCAPCRMLEPVLERLAEEFAGRARIVTVDTENEPELTAAHAIRSLPTLRIFRHGTAVDEIIGLQPDSAIRTAIERFLERQSDRDRATAAGMMADGRCDEAVLLLQKVLHGEPDNALAKVELAEGLAAVGKVEAAEKLLAQLPLQAIDAPRLKAAQARVLLAGVVAGQPGRDQLEQRIASQADDLLATCALAAREFLAGAEDTAFRRWLDAMRRRPGFMDGLARRCLLAAFELAGGDEEHIGHYRRQMMALLH